MIYHKVKVSFIFRCCMFNVLYLIIIIMREWMLVEMKAHFHHIRKKEMLWWIWSP